MKILIVNPPHPVPLIREGRCQSPQDMRKNSIPQMTLAYLAGVLGREGHSLVVRDCIALGEKPEDLFAALSDFSPQLALINTTTPSITNDVLFAKEFREQFPECFIAFFGTHVTALSSETLAEAPFLDAIIRNEPEWTAMELARTLEKGPLDGEEIPGLTARVKGEVVAFPNRQFSPDLDALGFPDWRSLPLNSYIHPIFNKPYVMVNTSRGCIHNCIFCVGHQFYGKKVRFRSVESILDEIENYLMAELGIRHFWFYADDFTRSAEYVKKLCRAIIDRNLKITWWTNTRVDNKDEEMFALMKQAGCYMLSIGGESGNAEMLKRIKKGTRPQDIRETVKILRKVGINSLVYFLIGLPGETRETIRETVEFAKSIQPDYVEFYPAIPYPGTEFYAQALEQKLIVDGHWNAYMCGGSDFVVHIQGVEKDELEKILRQAYREFYFRPSYFLIVLRRIAHPSEFFRLMKFGISYMLRFFK